MWLCSAGSAFAHHGVANFDLNTEIEIRGTVTRIAFVNPHSWLYLDVTGEDGRVTAWRCELRGASVLRRSGWTPEMFAPGTSIAITGAPDRFETNTCYLGTAVFANGTRIDRYGQIERVAAPTRVERPLRLPNGQPNISGDWAAEQRMLTDPRGMSGAFPPDEWRRRWSRGRARGTRHLPGGTAVSLAEDRSRLLEPAERDGADRGGARCHRGSTVHLLTIHDYAAATSEHPVRLGRSRRMPHQSHEQQRSSTLRYGSMGLERTVYVNMAEHPADISPPVRGIPSAAGTATSSSSTQLGSRQASCRPTAASPTAIACTSWNALRWFPTRRP
jgi:hypothetical protein